MTLAMAWADEPPPPALDLVSYVRCDRVDALVSLPSLVDALQGLAGQKIPFDAPEVAGDRPVVFYVGANAQLWLPMMQGKDRPAGSERGGGTWTDRGDWAVLTQALPPVLGDVPRLGDLIMPRGSGCTIASGVAPDDEMRNNGDRMLMHLDPRSPEHLSLRHLGTALPDQLANQTATKPRYPAAAKGTFATASYARLNLEPASDVAVMVDSELKELQMSVLLPALARLGRVPVPGTEIAQGPGGKPSFVVVPFKRKWKTKELTPFATELATAGLKARVDGAILVAADDLFIGTSGRHMAVSNDRHAIEDFAAGRGGSLLGPTFRAVVETPGMVLFKNGAYSNGPTTWVSLDPKAATMDMSMQQAGLFGMLGQTAIPGLAHLAGRVLEATPIRVDQLYSKAGPLALRGDEPVAGAKDGRFQVVEFLDFGCAHCAETSPMIPGFLAANPDVGLRTKVFPLTGACNPGLQDRGDGSCLAAIAAHCAHEQGKFAEMSSEMFAADWSAFDGPGLAAMGSKIGLDGAKLATCSADPRSRERVVDDAKAGDAAGVDGTPTFFIRGAVADPALWVRVDGRLEDVAMIVAAARSGSNLPNP